VENMCMVPMGSNVKFAVDAGLPVYGEGWTTPREISRPPAHPGQHTEEALRDWGFGPGEVARRAAGVIAQSGQADRLTLAT
jgi:hypothetical protein